MTLMTLAERIEAVTRLVEDNRLWQGGRRGMAKQRIDPYEAVLADLKAKREAIDNAIKTIEVVRGGATVAGDVAPAAERNSGYRLQDSLRTATGGL